MAFYRGKECHTQEIELQSIVEKEKEETHLLEPTKKKICHLAMIQQLGWGQ